MKLLISNILFLVVTGALIIGIGSTTYVISTQKKDEVKQTASSTTKTTEIKNNYYNDDDGEDDDYRAPQTTKQSPLLSNTTPTNTPANLLGQDLKGQANTAKTFTASDVASHNSATSCWSVVNGNVYDLTSYISKHPGGQGAIKSICGVDGSEAFNNQHGGQNKPENILQSFFIGSLKK